MARSFVSSHYNHRAVIITLKASNFQNGRQICLCSNLFLCIDGPTTTGGGGGGWFAGLSGSLRYAALAFLGLSFGKLGSCSILICRWLKRTRDLVDLQGKHQAIFPDLSMCLFVVSRSHRRVCHIQV